MMRGPDDDLVFGSIAEHGARLRRRAVSALELTETYLARIEALNPRLNAFITVTRAGALDRARRADAELAAGRDRGALHGIPYALKDVIATKGILTTNGSRASADWVPDSDATVETRLDEAGGILLGKLNLWEFAMVGAAYGDVHNPWATEYSPGGSSSGAGAAVAAGLTPLAIGTDTGGSVRVPAAHCGLVGLRPTYGRVSRYGVTANAWSVDTVGPLTRTVEDAASVLAIIAGSDPRDRTCARTAVPRFDASTAGDVRGLRVGIPKEHFFDAIHPDVEAAVRQASAVLGTLGARIVPVDLPHAGASGLARTLHLAEAAAFHEQRLRDRGQLLGSELRARLERATSYAAVDYLKALRLRTVLTDEATRAFQACDVIVAPTDRGLPARLGPSQPGAAPTFGGPNTYFSSMTGMPSLAVPCGFSALAPSLPISMLLHARQFDETTLFRVGHAFQKATDWHLRRPTI
jgi:aspartyl-tRNA(Asn)/glutamyl-tRNA(Gln) amidotransferase subunit A